MVQCIRKWQIFPGKNRILCDGRIIMARQTGVFYITILIILTTSILFFAFDCPYLARHVSISIPIVAIFVLGFVFCTLLRTSFIDPGIIPRASAREAEYITRHAEGAAKADGVSLPNAPRYKEVLINGQLVKLKYCFTCKIFRPPRASHCSLCDNCVERFDHHCPWVGNCVGKRNYRFFYMFLLSLTILCVYILAFSVTHIVLLMKTHNFIESIKLTPASLLVAIICFFSIWSILGLTGFHTYLSTSEQTTNEDIKGTFSSRKGRNLINPYSKGSPICNWFNVICGPLPPSLIDLRGTVPAPAGSPEEASRHDDPSSRLPPEVLERMRAHLVLAAAQGSAQTRQTVYHSFRAATQGCHGNQAHDNATFDYVPNGLHHNYNCNNSNEPPRYNHDAAIPTHSHQDVVANEDACRSHGNHCGAATSGYRSADSPPYHDSDPVPDVPLGVPQAYDDSLAHRAISPIFNYGTMTSSSFNALLIDSSGSPSSSPTSTTSSQQAAPPPVDAARPGLEPAANTPGSRQLCDQEEPRLNDGARPNLEGAGKRVTRRTNAPPANLSLPDVGKRKDNPSQRASGKKAFLLHSSSKAFRLFPTPSSSSNASVPPLDDDDTARLVTSSMVPPPRAMTSSSDTSSPRSAYIVDGRGRTRRRGDDAILKSYPSPSLNFNCSAATPPAPLPIILKLSSV